MSKFTSGTVTYYDDRRARYHHLHRSLYDDHDHVDHHDGSLASVYDLEAARQRRRGLGDGALDR